MRTNPAPSSARLDVVRAVLVRRLADSPVAEAMRVDVVGGSGAAIVAVAVVPPVVGAAGAGFGPELGCIPQVSQ